MQETADFILNRDAFESALNSAGYRSISELARKLGLHRNTITAYLRGAPALPQALSRILSELKLSPSDAILETRPHRDAPERPIATVIDDLAAQCPDAAYVLFGSRARGTSKKYSDYDLGVFRKQSLPLTLYSSLLNKIAEWNSTTMTEVQLTDLSRAPESFLESIRSDMCFMSGSRREWLNLLEHAGIETNEQ